MRPASGWTRLAAFGLDYLLILLYMGLLAAIALTVAAPLAARVAAPWQSQLLGFAALTLPVVLYFALTESLFGATLGKRLLGLRVTDLSGAPLPLGRSLLRSAVKFLPWELAHTAVHRLVFWTAEGASLTARQVAFLVALDGLSLLLAAYFVVSLFVPAHRTLYDYLAGSRVQVVSNVHSSTGRFA